jgi:hypothetical protein
MNVIAKEWLRLSTGERMRRLEDRALKYKKAHDATTS